MLPTGGVIQVSAEADDLEDALLRCRQCLNRNLGLDHNDSFKQLAVLMLAKIHDETLSTGEPKFWIRGDEPFTEAGQQAIAQRINEFNAVPASRSMVAAPKQLLAGNRTLSGLRLRYTAPEKDEGGK